MPRFISDHPWGSLLILLGTLGLVLLLSWSLLLRDLPCGWDGWLELAQGLLLLANLIAFWIYVITTQNQLRNQEAHLAAVREQLRTQSNQLELQEVDLKNRLVEKLKENKPIVFTDAQLNEPGERTFLVRNVGHASAVNVWYLEDGGTKVPLGSLASGESRVMPPEIIQRIVTPGDHRHLLFAEARPHTGRPWTVTVNVRTERPEGTFVHAFAVPDLIDRGGTIEEFLQAEGETLFEALRGTYPITHPPGEAS